MPTYRAPISDLIFLLQDVFDYERQTTTLPGFEEVTLDVVAAILKGAAEFVQERVLPINLPGDAAGCTWDNGSVTTPPGYKAAYEAYCSDGWAGLAAEREHGGHGLPPSLALMVRELVASGSMSFGMYAGLTQSAYRAISAHASEAIKQVYLPKLADGTWTGTMCLTEPQSGSDLSSIRTRAQPVDDGEYQITGTKIFISSGDHDLTENIVHLVLARLPDAPTGTRGLSLFVVPKRVPILENGEVSGTVPNPVSCGSIEHKMGIRAQSTAVLNFDGARGWLIGKPNEGMRAMFTMMNSSRVGVAVQSVGVAEIAWQNALAYTKERRQGRSPISSRNLAGQMDPIVAHPDVRKNLLTMKAYVEGMRALYVEAAMHLDIKARHPEQVVRDTADGMLSLLTPVIKAFVSDLALDVTELGIHVFGGHGYIQENGMEQFYRDARIVPLYEGTNSIQALDLVHRKLALDDGGVIERYLNQLSVKLDEQRLSNPRLLDLCATLENSLKLLRESTTIVSHSVEEKPVEAAAAAGDYLRMFGLVALGAAWLRMAAAADTALMQSPDNEDFLAGKVKTARFYFERFLPDVRIRHSIIAAGARSLTEISDTEF